MDLPHAMLSLAELRRCQDVATDCAMEGGNLIRDCMEKADLSATEEKSCATDLVTEYDKKIEVMIMTRLRKEFPSFSTLGEESDDKKPLGNEPTWVVDPIDGTLSFMHKSFDCCILIGLSVNRRSVLGVCYNPVLNELYTAIEGQGAFCNGRRIKTSGQKSLKNSLVCSHFPSFTRSSEFVDNLFSIWRSLMQVPVQGMRAFGSCGVDICSVASGRLDCYFEVGICAWDVCAPAVIIKEAGGVILDVTGGPFNLENRRMLSCSTPELAEEVLQILKKHLRLDVAKL
eukprot:TRINITY_DN4798_c2_g1_i1.p1 TRINITY_DN4798_c2_g1~~TRINITY_DN4798_c2_g1_i1.p1  ORF type:complete len:299 (+),score=56.89 TRINITY_DN4798_c2_g1_i1:41-898(+)